MNLYALGRYGHQPLRPAAGSKPQSSPPALQFGSEANEVRKMLRDRNKMNTMSDAEFRQLCQQSVWSGQDVEGREIALNVAHFLQDVFEHGVKSVDRFMAGLNPTAENVQTLKNVLDQLKSQKIVGEYSAGTYALDIEGLERLERAFPDLKLPENGYLFDDTRPKNFCAPDQPLPKKGYLFDRIHRWFKFQH